MSTTEAGERERIAKVMERIAYNLAGRKDPWGDLRRIVETLERGAHLLRTEPCGEAVAWKVQHRNYVELWTDRRKANAFQQAENLRETYPDDEVTLTPLYLRPAAPVEPEKDR